MPDNIFENKLNEQLGDFKFSPSDEVWQKLEKDLTKRKKRRTGFIWFFAGLLLVSAGLIIVSRNNEETKLSDTITNNTNHNSKGDLKTVDGNTESPEENHLKTIGPVKKSPMTGVDSTSNVKAYSAKQNLTATVPSLLNPSFKNSASRITVKGKSKEPATDKVNSSTPLLDNLEPNPSLSFSPDLAMVDPVPGQKQLQVPAEINGIIKIVSPVSSHKPVTADSVSQIDAVKTTTTHKRPVTFGFRIEGGRSATPEELFSPQKSADMNSIPNTGSSPVVFYPYEQNPSFGWSFGAWIKKPLSPKVTLQSGLMYHQYRTSTPVGRQGQGTFVTGSGTGSMSYDQYFLQGDSMNYANRYHLLSVPAAFSFLLNKGKSLPFSWYAGIEPGWLVGSNALIKDTSGILYSDSDFFNRFQVGLETGFSFRLWNKSRHPIELGPVFRYMISPVFKNGTNYAGHLSFIGLRADWTLFNLKQKQR